MNIRLLLILMLTTALAAVAQQREFFEVGDGGVLPVDNGAGVMRIRIPQGAYHDPAIANTPVLNFVIPLKSPSSDIQVEVTDTTYRLVSGVVSTPIIDQVVIEAVVHQTHNQYAAFITVNPYRKGVYGMEMITEIGFSISGQPLSYEPMSEFKNSAISSSVLGSGNWLKVGIVEDGMYRINRDELENAGWNVNQLDPRNIAVYGNGGGMLPEANSDSVIDDLYENAIRVIGEQDGNLGSGDYILFYAEGPHRWNYENERFRHEFNVYSDTNYYFITVKNQPGKRVQSASTPTNENITTTSCDCYDFHERDLVNIAGTGRKWFGEYFDITNTYNFTFDLTNRLLGEPVWMNIGAAAQSSIPRTFDVLQGNNVEGSVLVSATTAGQYSDVFKDAQNDFTFMSNTPNAVSVTVRFNNALSSATGWLDFLTVNARCALNFSSSNAPMRIVDSEVVGPGNVARYAISGSGNYSVWNITNPLEPYEVPLNSGSQGSFFRHEADQMEYFILHSGVGYKSPASLKTVANQNLHALGPIDYFIITNRNMIAEAQRLADWHSSRGLVVKVIDVDEIYNEYSTGRQDIAGIRNFIRDHFYKHEGHPNQLKYVFMFGDTSYDFKDRIDNNSNIIPTYETIQSGGLGSGSYCADDFFGMLSPGEGNLVSGGTMEVALGRVPIVNAAQAANVVDKIIHYSSSNSFGDWKNRIVLVTDDSDQTWENGFVNNSENYANFIDTLGPQYNFEKIYSDAYVEQTTSAGQRYPDVQDEINLQVNRGALIVNYTGHGGEEGWTSERILENADVNSWTNFDRLTTFLTVTCEFTRIDDPMRVSAGEYCILNPEGGAVSLFSTTRIISAGFGYSLNNAFYRLFFDDYQGGRVRMGDLMKELKNGISSTAKYSIWLFGDPALEFAVPQRETVVSAINGVPIDQFNDTIAALEKVTFSGRVLDSNGQTDVSYNGVLQPTIFDKKKARVTRDNSQIGSQLPFWTQNNTIYKGNASIVNGEWSFEFIVPKDIDYSLGESKISLYFSNEMEDGAGGDNAVSIGGSNPNPPTDTTGPELALYMNDYSFVSGGITDDSPIFLAKLIDFSGINTTGNGIGHDLVAYLDGDRSKPYYLNSFYSADLDSYQSGEVRYPFSNLEDGRHHIEMIAWDVYNNSARGEIEFVVADANGLVLDQLRNYPNPFVNETNFVFEHNRPNEPLEIVLSIYSTTGKLVRTITGQVQTEGFQVTGFKWDGLTDSGGYVERGVYVYHVTVRGMESGEVAHAYERLVLMR